MSDLEYDGLNDEDDFSDQSLIGSFNIGGIIVQLWSISSEYEILVSNGGNRFYSLDDAEFDIICKTAVINAGIDMRGRDYDYDKALLVYIITELL